jgi:hypothetical protein
MKEIPKLSLVVAFLACCFVFGSVFAEEPKTVDTRPELLILKNGQILEGRVTKLKKHYLVDLQNGEIQVRYEDVDFVCRTREEGYTHKREIIEAGDWRNHLELARWCFKNGLSQQAEDELTAAEGFSPNNPMIDSMRRQMKPVETTVKPEKTRAADELAETEELDRMVRNLPPKAMENFTQAVQPMLMNNCTSSGCHGPLSMNNLRLIRVSSTDAANRRSTQRNLQTVLQYIDREKPLDSPLLKMPASPHGTAKNAVFTERRSSQYLRLAEWVASFGGDELSPVEELLPHGSLPNEASGDAISPPKLLSRDAQKAKPLGIQKGAIPFSSDENGDSPLKKGKPLVQHRKPKEAIIPEQDLEPSGVQRASYQEPPAEFLDSKNVRPHKAPTSPTKRQTTSSPKVQRGAPLPKAEDRDPLDPEIFNRRYHKTPPPKEVESSSDESPTTDTTPR